METIEVDGDFRLEPWIRLILQAACKLYYTKFYITERIDFFRYYSIKVPVFIGTAENIAVTIDIATWLIDSVRMESNRAYKASNQRRSFRMGAADRIYERATDLVEGEKRAGLSSGTSLVAVRNQLERANQVHLAKLNLRPFKSRSVYVSADAYADGEAFGSQVRLGDQGNKTNSVKGLLPNFASK